MELQGSRRSLPPPSPLGGEQQQMLTLNRRLEGYLGRVRQLEEENRLLQREVQALGRSGQGVWARRRGLEEDLRRARLDVEAAWRERDLVEAELGGLGEELGALGQQRRREEEAREQAERRLAEEERALEEERRAQAWLRERMSQLEAELESQTRTHRDDVAHLRAEAPAHSGPAVPPPPAPAQLPGLLALGEEYSQWAARAWNDASEEYRNQAARLEESLTLARSGLGQADQEKNQNLLKLRDLERELAAAQDVRQHLETSLVQQRDRRNQEIQQLQAQLEAREEEKGQLGQQMDALLGDSRGLLQLKMSLGLEVATYRALLDNERLEDRIPAPQPRSAYINDLAPRPPWAQPRFQLSSMNRALSSIRGASPRSKTKTISTTSIWTQKHATVSETPAGSLKTEEEQVDLRSTPYPKVLQGSVDHFRPQDVHEEVNYAEPFSPPNEQGEVGDAGPWVGSDQKDLITADREEGDNLFALSAAAPETEPVVESVCHQLKSSLFGPPVFTGEAEERSSPTDILGTECPVTKSERPSRFPGDNANEASFEMPAEKAKPRPDFPPPPTHAWKDPDLGREKHAAWIEEGSSESETEALIEPTLENSTSSPASESQAEEGMFYPTELQEEEIPLQSMGLAEASDENNVSWRNVEELEDKVYLDGAEMDAWDQVIERKVCLKEDGMKVEEDESESQHMELEEDMSALYPEQEERQIKNEVSPIPADDGAHMTFELMDTEQDTERQEKTAPEEEESLDTSDREDGDDEEADDSPNASGSWRTELESDSYAQDNTLADTRPLIRYKSDETDANAQVSHMDESESSDGEEARTGTGAWGGSRSKRFGTMEDLCEETAGETLDEEDNMGSNQTEDVSAGQDVSLDDDEHATNQNILRGEEQQSDEETEELPERGEPIVHSSEDYNEESIDRMVEQELEGLSISTYTAQFQQSQNIVEEALGAEQTEPAVTHTHEHEDLEQRDTEITSSVQSVILNEPYEYQSSKESSEEVTQVEVFAEDQVFSEEQEIEDVPEKDKEDEQNLSILTQVDLAEGDISVLCDLNNQPGNQVNINNPDISGDEDESSNASQCSQPMTRVKSAYVDVLVDVAGPLTEKPLSGLQEHLVERYDCHVDHEHLQTEEWEVLEDPIKHLESDGSSVVGHSMYDTTLEPSQSLEPIQRGIHPELEAQQEDEDIDAVQPAESPDTMPEESNIFQLEESDDRPTTKSKDLHGVFSSGVHNQFWSSALDTGASYQPDESYDNNTAEQSNQNLAFGGNIAWGSLGSLQVANGNTETEADTAKAAINKEEEEGRPAQAKKLPSGGVALEGERVHSEDSEDEGDSWSSGEE